MSSTNKAKMSPLSFFAVRLDMMRNGSKVGSGTGFIYQPAEIDQKFLVTNYHVITAREPRDPQNLLPGFPDSPDELQFTLLNKNGLNPRMGGLSLVANQDYSWIEHEDRAKGVDIAAIPVQFPDDAITVTQQQLGLVDDINFEVGSDLFIIGYPYGYGASDYFPIWKRGTVASEPLVEPEGLARFYIDSFTKPGMSGSPVFAMEIRNTFLVGADTKSNFEEYERGETSALDVIRKIGTDELANPVPTKYFQLVGIYSGKITVHGHQDPNVGIVWQRKLIDEMFAEPTIVKHPYPPLTT